MSSVEYMHACHITAACLFNIYIQLLRYNQIHPRLLLYVSENMKYQEILNKLCIQSK